MKLLSLGIVFLLALAGALVFVDSLDDVYSSTNTDVAVVFPGDLEGGRQSSISVLATDLDGEPMGDEDVVVEVVSETGVEYYYGKTGPDGFAAVDLEVPPDVGNVTIVVTVDGREFLESVRVLDDSSVSIIIQTDKPIYQPGQEVHMRFITLDAASGLPVADPLTIEIFTPEGDKVLEETLAVSEWGISAADMALSDLLPLGDYTVVASAAGGSEERTFLVDRYVLPRFIISAEGMAPWYTPDDTIEFDVVADYSFGQPVLGEVEVAVIGYDSVWSTWTHLDDLAGEMNGTFTVAPDLSTANGSYDALLFNVTVTDGAGHSESKTLSTGYYTSPLMLSVIGDWNVAGLESTYWFIVNYPDGTQVQADLDVTLYAYEMEGLEDDIEPWVEEWEWDLTGAEEASKGWAGSDEVRYLPDAYYGYGYVQVDSVAVETDERGVAALSFDFVSPVMFMRVNVTDGETVANHTFDLWGIEDGLKVVPDSPAYEVGETATFAVYSSGGLSTTGYYDVYASGVRVRSGTFPLGGGAGTIAFTVDPGMAPGIEVRATRISDMVNPVTSSAIVAVVDPGAVSVSLAASGTVHRPGEGVTVDVGTTSHERAIEAALGVRIVDSSVFELAERLTADERYDAAEVYSALLYIDAKAEEPVTSAVLQPSGDVRMSVGAFVHDDRVANDYRAAGGSWLIVALGLVCIPILLVMSRRSRTGAAYAVLAIALVVLPSAAVLGPAIDTEGPGRFGRYVTGSSPEYQEPADEGREVFMEAGEG
ncbi:MAG: MG2 domain-containing protein, partial [Thermoplasmata archaeon]|nr:MG2 domain-containing protein [Thermoplasmata archaeon]